MTEQVPNVHDDDIRRMVLRDHEPREEWGAAGILLGVHCDVCGHEWPCASIQAARTIEDAQKQYGGSA